MKRFLVLLGAFLASCAAAPIQPDPVSQETRVRHARPRLDQERFDSQEFDPRLAECFSSADARAEREVANVPRNEDFILKFWEAKKRLLEQRCGIHWASPADMNPAVEYDSYGQPKLSPGEVEAVRAVVTLHLASQDEKIGWAWRMFNGQVYVVTRSGDLPVVRHYQLHGHDEDWEFVNVWIMEE